MSTDNPPSPSVAFEKLHETPDLMKGSEAPFVRISSNSKPWKNWLLWVTDAITVFSNGCIASGKPGMVVGAANGTQATTVNIEDITARAVVGYFVTVFVLGYFDFVSWHKEHQMPNPFRK